MVCAALLGGIGEVRAQQAPSELAPLPTPQPHPTPKARPKPRPVHGSVHEAATSAPAEPVKGAHAPAPSAPDAKSDTKASAATTKPAVKPAAPKVASNAVPTTEAKPPPPPIDPAVGTETKLPLPRWASLRYDEVNLRRGPGTRYEIEWIYRRQDLPVRILREFGLWRLIEDQDLVKGWVHQATLVRRRDFIVTGGERILRDAAKDTGDAVARLKPGVIGRILKCEEGSDWCEVQVSSNHGWLKREEFWGTLAGEPIQ